jgi:hypothetical protein
MDGVAASSGRQAAIPGCDEPVARRFRLATLYGVNWAYKNVPTAVLG